MLASTPTEAQTKLADAVSIWRLLPSTAKDVVDAATDCLVAGLDSPSLRVLAGSLPKDSWFVLEPLVADTLDELGMPGVVHADVQRAGLTAMLRRLKSGRVTPRGLAFWAHTHIGHDGDLDCQVFVNLDDMYDEADYVGYQVSELDRWTEREADAFLAGRPSPGHTLSWPLLPPEPKSPGWLARLRSRLPRGS